ncbi:MAG: glycosyltransferase family 4 protein [Deltaproteobacteria bacterium]|nr:glycosyltransferase family 4 protein [Deltaproteobacteria bacterium]
MNNRKRYLVITEKFTPRKGGSNTTFDEIYRRIGDKDTHIVTCDQPGAAAFDTTHPNTVHRLSLDRHRWLRPESLAIYAKLVATSLVLAARYEFDEVHAGRVLSEGLVGLLVARLKGLPLVIYAHGEEITTWRQPGKFQAMVFTYRQADRLNVNSNFTRRELLKLGVKPERIVLILPGVDLKQFRPGLEASDLRTLLSMTEGQKLILSVGRLSRRKGFDQVIHSLPFLVDKGINAQYAIVGIGEDRDYLLFLARELAVSDRVHILGHVSSDDLPRWFNAADVFAMPNRNINGDTEGFGMVFLEAAACGKPAVAGHAGGTGDAVADGMTGLRVDGGSLEEVAAALERLLEDPGFAERLGSSGYARASKAFSWDVVAEKISAIFKG